MATVKIKFCASERNFVHSSLADFVREQAQSCRQEGRLGTARNYLRTLSSFNAFSGGRNISLASLDGALVRDYEKWLSFRGMSRNSSSFYMRNLRSLYNKAVRQGYVCQTFPFTEVYTGIDRTPKRAVDESLMLRLLELDLSHSRPLALSRDLFVFSYCTRGMSFVDMAYLRKKDISAGTITYVRRKTGQKMNVHIEKCIGNILEHYGSMTSSSPYVFPIISSSDPETAHRQYRIALNYHNRKLKQLGALLACGRQLSSYTARHTWATVAQRRNVPLSIISAGMGHSSERTTRIYLAGLENSAIDMANSVILEMFNK